MTFYNESGYIEMLRTILRDGQYRKPANEIGRYESFGQYLTFDLRNGTLPLFTTKKVQFKSLAVELLWFLTGSCNIEYLHQNGVHIWDPWANEMGDVGPLYGYQWRHWHDDVHQGYIDQMAECMRRLAERPEARSHVVVAYRPDHIRLMSIKPCHVYLQFYLFGNNLDLLLVMRSWDAFLGAPFNVAQFSLLTHLVAHQLGCFANRLMVCGADVHIYENHVEQVRRQIENPILTPPKIEIVRRAESLFDYRFEDFRLAGYEHAGPLPGEISVQGQPGQGCSEGLK